MSDVGVQLSLVQWEVFSAVEESNEHSGGYLESSEANGGTSRCFGEDIMSTARLFSTVKVKLQCGGRIS